MAIDDFACRGLCGARRSLSFPCVIDCATLSYVGRAVGLVSRSSQSRPQLAKIHPRFSSSVERIRGIGGEPELPRIARDARSGFVAVMAKLRSADP